MTALLTGSCSFCLCFVSRFLLQFVVGIGLDQGVATLHVVETNPFKHLTHLSLKFLPGSDAEVKKYLASCLKNLLVRIQQLDVQYCAKGNGKMNFVLCSLVNFW